MKLYALILTLALVLAQPVHAEMCAQEVDAATSNVGTSFSTASTSKKSFVGCLRQMLAVCLDNNTATTLVMACNGDTSPPSDSDAVNTTAKRMIVYASKRQCMDTANVGPICYVKGRAGASSGGFILSASGN